MIMAKLKSAKGKKFLFGLLAVFIIAASVVTRWQSRWEFISLAAKSSK